MRLGTSSALVAVLSSALFAATVTRAQAAPAGAPLVSVRQAFPHGYVEATLSPGQSVAATLDVSNGSAVPATYLVSAVDAYTSSASGVVYGNRQTQFRDGPAGNGQYGAGAWITVSASQLQLNPGRGQAVNVSATVPSTATPGDWVGGVTLENPAASGSGGTGTQLSITTATEVAIVIHVPGNANVGAVFLGQPTIVADGSQQFLDIPLRYTGDVLTKPTYAFTIRDSSGRVAYSHDDRWDTFMPHTTMVYRVLMTSILPPGSYTFTGSAGPGGNPTTAEYPVKIKGAPIALPTPRPSTSATVPSPLAPATAWPFVLPALLALLFLMLLVLVRRHRNRCSHCGRGRIGALMRVGDFQEIAHCHDCRRRALEREDVSLCPECYRSHVLPRGGLNPRPA